MISLRTPIDSRPDSNANVGWRLRLLREAMGWSQAEICRRTGIATNTWSQYETGASRPNLDMGLRIAETLGIQTDYIWRGVETYLPGIYLEPMRRMLAEQERESA